MGRGCGFLLVLWNNPSEQLCTSCVRNSPGDCGCGLPLRNKVTTPFYLHSCRPLPAARLPPPPWGGLTGAALVTQPSLCSPRTQMGSRPTPLLPLPLGREADSARASAVSFGPTQRWAPPGTWVGSRALGRTCSRTERGLCLTRGPQLSSTAVSAERPSAPLSRLLGADVLVTASPLRGPVTPSPS